MKGLSECKKHSVMQWSDFSRNIIINLSVHEYCTEVRLCTTGSLMTFLSLMHTYANDLLIIPNFLAMFIMICTIFDVWFFQLLISKLFFVICDNIKIFCCLNVSVSVAHECKCGFFASFDDFGNLNYECD